MEEIVKGWNFNSHRHIRHIRHRIHHSRIRIIITSRAADALIPIVNNLMNKSSTASRYVLGLC